jgi:hypothetical protein
LDASVTFTTRPPFTTLPAATVRDRSETAAIALGGFREGAADSPATQPTVAATRTSGIERSVRRRDIDKGTIRKEGHESVPPQAQLMSRRKRVS